MNFEQHLRHHKEVVDREVEGWFYPIDIILMYGVLNHLQKDKDGCVCEIGVAHGKSAIMISMFRNGEKFYLYDIFSEEAREKAEQNIYNYGNARDLIWKLQDTTDLKFDDLDYENIKLLHIDGCHEHPSVVNDQRVLASRWTNVFEGKNPSREQLHQPNKPNQTALNSNRSYLRPETMCWISRQRGGCQPGGLSHNRPSTRFPASIEDAYFGQTNLHLIDTDKEPIQTLFVNKPTQKHL